MVSDFVDEHNTYLCLTEEFDRKKIFTSRTVEGGAMFFEDRSRVRGILRQKFHKQVDHSMTIGEPKYSIPLVVSTGIADSRLPPTVAGELELACL